MSAPFFVEDISDFQIPFVSRPVAQKEEVKWYEPTEENKCTRCIRVIITSQDDASLFIYFQNPEMPEYTVSNSTSKPVTIQIKGSNKNLLKLEARQTLPFVWPDPTSDEKKVIIFIGKNNKSYDITSIGKQKRITGPSGAFYHVQIIARNFGREIVIIENKSRKITTAEVEQYKSQVLRRPNIEEFKADSNEEEKKEIAEKSDKSSAVDPDNEKEEETHNKNDLKVECKLVGIGVSLVDNEPKELIYLSCHELDIELEKKVVVDEKICDTNYFLKFNIGHVQVDNMLNKSFPIIFGPHKLFMADSKTKSKEEDWQPFVQMQTSVNQIQEGNFSITRCNSLQLQLSEMAAFVDLAIITNLVNLIMAITDSFKPPTMLRQAKAEERKVEYYLPQKVFPSLNPYDPDEPQSEIIGKNNIFIELLHLSGIKLRVSLRLERDVVDPTGPLAIVQALYSVVANISNISDAPIYFTELIMKNTYTPFGNLVKSLRKKYTRQAIFQSYSLLGSIDLIGNPIGLLDRLGSGVFEFINEPRKGLLKGPKEFAQGVGKGVKSLITNVIGGSLSSVSRVTGSLYSLVKYGLLVMT